MPFSPRPSSNPATQENAKGKGKSSSNGNPQNEKQPDKGNKKYGGDTKKMEDNKMERMKKKEEVTEQDRELTASVSETMLMVLNRVKITPPLSSKKADPEEGVHSIVGDLLQCIESDKKNEKQHVKFLTKEIVNRVNLVCRSGSSRPKFVGPTVGSLKYMNTHIEICEQFAGFEKDYGSKFSEVDYVSEFRKPLFDAILAKLKQSLAVASYGTGKAPSVNVSPAQSSACSQKLTSSLIYESCNGTDIWNRHSESESENAWECLDLACRGNPTGGEHPSNINVSGLYAAKSLLQFLVRLLHNPRVFFSSGGHEESDGLGGREDASGGQEDASGGQEDTASEEGRNSTSSKDTSSTISRHAMPRRRRNTARAAASPTTACNAAPTPTPPTPPSIHQNLLTICSTILDTDKISVDIRVALCCGVIFEFVEIFDSSSENYDSESKQHFDLEMKAIFARLAGILIAGGSVRKLSNTKLKKNFTKVDASGDPGFGKSSGRVSYDPPDRVGGGTGQNNGGIVTAQCSLSIQTKLLIRSLMDARTRGWMVEVQGKREDGNKGLEKTIVVNHEKPNILAKTFSAAFQDSIDEEPNQNCIDEEPSQEVSKPHGKSNQDVKQDNKEKPIDISRAAPIDISRAVAKTTELTTPSKNALKNFRKRNRKKAKKNATINAEGAKDAAVTQKDNPSANKQKDITVAKKQQDTNTATKNQKDTDAVAKKQNDTNTAANKQKYAIKNDMRDEVVREALKTNLSMDAMYDIMKKAGNANEKEDPEMKNDAALKALDTSCSGSKQSSSGALKEESASSSSYPSFCHSDSYRGWKKRARKEMDKRNAGGSKNAMDLTQAEQESRKLDSIVLEMKPKDEQDMASHNMTNQNMNVFSSTAADKKRIRDETEKIREALRRFEESQRVRGTVVTVQTSRRDCNYQQTRKACRQIAREVACYIESAVNTSTLQLGSSDATSKQETLNQNSLKPETQQSRQNFLIEILIAEVMQVAIRGMIPEGMGKLALSRRYENGWHSNSKIVDYATCDHTALCLSRLCERLLCRLQRGPSAFEKGENNFDVGDEIFDTEEALPSGANNPIDHNNHAHKNTDEIYNTQIPHDCSYTSLRLRHHMDKNIYYNIEPAGPASSQRPQLFQNLEQHQQNTDLNLATRYQNALHAGVRDCFDFFVGYLMLHDPRGKADEESGAFHHSRNEHAIDYEFVRRNVGFYLKQEEANTTTTSDAAWMFPGISNDITTENTTTSAKKNKWPLEDKLRFGNNNRAQKRAVKSKIRSQLVQVACFYGSLMGRKIVPELYSYVCNKLLRCLQSAATNFTKNALAVALCTFIEAAEERVHEFAKLKWEEIQGLRQQGKSSDGAGVINNTGLVRYSPEILEKSTNPLFGPHMEMSCYATPHMYSFHMEGSGTNYDPRSHGIFPRIRDELAKPRCGNDLPEEARKAFTDLLEWRRKVWEK